MQHKTLVAALAAAVSLTVLGAAPAQAADQVTISKIGTKTAKYKAKAKLNPVVKTSGNVALDSKSLTVKKGKKTIAKNKRSVNLKAGTYKVTTNVKYRTYTNTTQQVPSIAAGDLIVSSNISAEGPHIGTPCAVTSYRSDTDFNISCDVIGGLPAKIDATDDNISSYSRYGGGVGDARYGSVRVDFLRSPVLITETAPAKAYSSPKTKTRTQTVKVKAGKKPAPPAKCATYAKFKQVGNDMTMGEVKRLLGRSSVQYEAGQYVNLKYKPCKSGQYFVVLFDDGYVWDKVYAG
jgi:hypothetical protein